MIYIDANAVCSILTMDKAIDVAEVAFKLYSNRQVVQPQRTILKTDGEGLMGMMPIYINNGVYKGFGVKTIVVKPNKEKGLPSHVGVILLFDEPNGMPIAMIDGAAITEIRTAAASGFATKLLSSKTANDLGILGTGAQARAHLDAISCVRDLQRVRVWGQTERNVVSMVAWAKSTLNIEVEIAHSPPAAVENADIICTTTSSKETLIDRSNISNGVHINAIGASLPGYKEIATNIFETVRFFPDSRSAILTESSEVMDALEAGVLCKDNLGIEIGELNQDQDQQTQIASQSTLFKSVGLAVQDITAARFVYDNFVEQSN